MTAPLPELMRATTVSSCGLDITIACHDRDIMDAIFDILTEARMTDRTARVYDVVEEGPGEIFLILGEGDGESDRWKVNLDQLRNATKKQFEMVFRATKS